MMVSVFSMCHVGFGPGPGILLYLLQFTNLSGSPQGYQLKLVYK